MEDAPTSYNRSVYASALKSLRLRKTADGLRHLCGFFYATVWAGVNASHCPITCPNRRKQPERYATVWFRLFSVILQEEVDKVLLFES